MQVETLYGGFQNIGARFGSPDNQDRYVYICIYIYIYIYLLYWGLFWGLTEAVDDKPEEIVPAEPQGSDPNPKQSNMTYL